MRALIAGPRTAVGGFHKKAAVFRPSPEPKLFGNGTGVRADATMESKVLPAMLFGLLVAVRMSYVRMQLVSAPTQLCTPAARAPVLRSTSRTLFLRMTVLPMLKQLPEKVPSGLCLQLVPAAKERKHPLP